MWKRTRESRCGGVLYARWSSAVNLGKGGSRRLFLQLGGPVEDDAEGSGGGVFDVGVDEEALAVAGHVVRDDIAGRDGLMEPSLKEGDRSAGFESATCGDAGGHHFPIERQKEKLFAVAAPTRLLSAVARDLPFVAGFGKWRDINFGVAAVGR